MQKRCFSWRTCEVLALIWILGFSACSSYTKPRPGVGKPIKHQKPILALPKFTDVTKQAGIHFQHVQQDEDKINLISETMAPGCAFADYDNDGDLDIYLVNGSGRENALYRNNGDGTFADVAKVVGVAHKGWGIGCVFGDYDNDGDLDLYVTNYNEPNVLYRNNGPPTYTFTDVTQQSGTGDRRWGASVAFADYDNDGDLDLYVANYLKFAEELVPKEYKILYRREEPVELAPEPFDPQENVFYRNNGDGTFTDVARKVGVANALGKCLGVTFGDYDNDNDLDLYVANDVGRNSLYRNNGDGTFTDVSFLEGVDDSRGGMGVTWADYDNDGDLDLFITNWRDQINVLYRNNLPSGDTTGEAFANFDDVTYATGIGEPSIPYVGWGCDLFDYDNDGYLDIFVANGFTSPNQNTDLTTCIPEPDQLFHNNGDGTFEDVSKSAGEYFQSKYPGRGAAFGDYDNDGDIDILIVNNNGPATLLRNDGGNRNNWLKIKTVGTKSNRNGIGARVIVKTGKLTQMREVLAGSSYLSHSSLELEFGLGTHNKADIVEIRWPSGRVQRLKNVAANQTLIFFENTDE